MRCPSCQAENDDSVALCFECGASLGAIVKGAVLSGRYEILKPLGKGGMGMVYLAHDRQLDEAVALKVLRSELAHSADLARRFRSEIKLARRVAHKNVCRIFEYGQDGHRQYIAMAYVDGVDLKRLLREGGPLPPDDAFDTAIRVADALEAIHDEGIVHRDLKTPNIMRDSKGVVRLMDFGIAKDQAAGSAADLTGTGQVIGSPEYMSPEQCLGKRADARSDIYALGIVVYEMFTGRLPFQADNPLQVMRLHVQEPPPLDAESSPLLPEPLRPVLERALAKEPAARFERAADMAEALRTARRACLAAPTPVPPRTLILRGPAAAAQPRDTPAFDTLRTPVPTAAPTAVPTRSVEETAPGPAARTPARGPLLLGGAVLAAGTVAALVGFWPEPPERAPVTASSGRPASPAATHPSPPAAVTALSLPAPGPSATAPPRATGTPSPLPSATARARPTSRPASPGEAAQAARAAQGTLQLTVVPPADVTVDGRPVTGSLRKIPLAAGRHVVRFEHADYRPIQRVVTIRAGEVTALEIDFAEDGVKTR